MFSFTYFAVRCIPVCVRHKTSSNDCCMFWQFHVDQFSFSVFNFPCDRIKPVKHQFLIACVIILLIDSNSVKNLRRAPQELGTRYDSRI